MITEAGYLTTATSEKLKGKTFEATLHDNNSMCLISNTELTAQGVIIATFVKPESQMPFPANSFEIL